MNRLSALHAVRLALVFRHSERSVVGGVCFLQVPPQVHIQGDGHAHDDQCAHAQDQEPPDHPHSPLG